ncbi:hypothetical protein TCAL_00961 [Tigriopus californicus]|uniref:Uncharacterized protein n=1 Tax=Tigriopus californicus TaxID=6832 RepID=A0A553P635_TIGCA|nr:G1/S-specific cyclin-D3-like [Tigriopus californicus]TRY73144.1 hypothetical protein TCAL_00961 [Tigriopus californicus]|eukprot:TCALIF_00961-PA protein Name:"Similar to CCND3 G1/S-specific cyclin-D3 (Homo sapiens)" AED:0.06 eAED:0.06 QI:108/1/1/1/1/1/3/320/318
MDDLFAVAEGELHCHESIVLTDSRSYEDQVLLKDRRVLENILNRQQDSRHGIVNYFNTVQSEIKPHMRKIVSDWMLEVCEEQQCHPEVFSLAINYMDRFLSQLSLQKHQFQLLASVCLFLASKFKETNPLPAENLVIYTDNSISTHEITQWELLVLDVLNWDLSAVTPYSILDHLLRTLEFDPKFQVETVRRHSETFVALAATEHVFCQTSPAVIAVACLASALRGLNAQGLDEMLAKLQGLTGVQKNAIQECMDKVEISISLSMSGVSFQPTNSSPAVAPNQQSTHSSTKIIPQQPGYYQHSTTPTDIMEISSTCVF